jgi:DNA-binding GntR family transcriptional regulator
MAPMQLERTNLREQARRVLRASIITGELMPGQLYTVGAFASKLGVSATPIREALGDLASFGLVEVVRNRGFVVSAVTEDDLDEIVELRLLLEPPVVERVAGRLTAQEVSRCREYVEQGITAATSGDLPGFLEADREFHLTVISALRNRRLVAFLSQLRDQTRLYGLRALADAGRLLASAQEHEELLKAVEEGDGVLARETMVRHLMHTRGSWAGRSESDE